MRKEISQNLKEWGKAALYVGAMLLIPITMSYAEVGVMEGQVGKFKSLLFGDVVAIIFGLCFGTGAAVKSYEGDFTGAGKCAAIAGVGSVVTSMISGGTIFNLLK